MAWTSPRTWVASEVVTAALMNTHLRDQLLWLASTTGLVQHEAGGVEVDISAVAKGGLVAGTGAGTMALQTVGTNRQLLTADSSTASGLAWSAKAAVLAATNTVEGTTSSTSEVTVVTVSGLSIATTAPVLVLLSFYKTSQAYFARLGLQDQDSAVLISQRQVTTNTGAGETGFGLFWIPPVETTYGVCAIDTITSGAYAVKAAGGLRANTTMTSLLIRGSVENGALTLQIKNVHVYTLGE